MRLPRECYQMQKTIETHLPVTSPSHSATGAGVVGLRGYSGRQLPVQNAVASALIALAQVEQPAPVSPRMALRRHSVPDKPLPNPAGRYSLLRTVAEMGPRLVKRIPVDWPWPSIPRSRATRPPPSSSAILYRSCAIPVAWRIHRATQKGSWMDPTVELLRELAPAVPKEMTVIVTLRPGHIQPQAMDADTRPGLASLYALPEEHHLLRPGRPPVARAALRFPSRYSLDWPRHRLQHSQSQCAQLCTLLVVWYAHRAGGTLDQSSPTWRPIR